jgi:4-hydroxy-tetrahydrodipicolinate synthase
MNDEEHVRMIELIVGEMRSSFPDATVIAGAGSNDTHHAVQLTERVTELRPDALLSVNPYYNRPSHRGIIRHYEEIDRATDLPILLYNIPQRTGSDLPNELIARLGELEHVVGVKQANHANLAPIDGLSIYAGNDDMLAEVLDMGEPGGVLTATHVFGREFRRMVDEPENRRRIHDSLTDVYQDMGIAPLACTIKTALNLLGLEVGEPRLPYVPLDEQEVPVIRALLERHGLLQIVET